MIAWWKQFISDMNSKGIPVPMFRDGKTGEASVTYTLLILSYALWAASVIGKAAGAVGGINTSDCFNMVIASSSLYLGRKMQRDAKGVLTVEELPKAEDAK
jgi:hypothetical protein